MDASCRWLLEPKGCRRRHRVIEGPNDILIEKSLHFTFKTSNNQAEYEAILAGLSLAREVGVKKLTCKTDSKLTVGHLNDEFQIKDPILQQYYHLVRAIIQSAFEQVRVEHIPRTDNVRADILSKLASTKLKNRNRSLLQQTLATPSVTHTCKTLTPHPIKQHHPLSKPKLDHPLHSVPQNRQPPSRRGQNLAGQGR